MASLLVSAAAGFGGFPTFRATPIHDILLTVALTTGLVAAICLACAVIVTSGYLLAAVVVLGARALARAVIRKSRLQLGAERNQPGTANAHNSIAYLDRYRRRRQEDDSNTSKAQSNSDDDTA
ncbi:hypothetical protein [Saccharopolyspora sp. NPDC002376]